MDFSLTEEQQEIQNLAAQILGDQVTADDLVKYDNGEAERFDGRLWGQLADAGLLGVALSEDAGGMNFGFSSLCLVLEEAGRVLAPVPLLTTTVSAMAIEKFADADTKGMLGGVATGEVVLTAAVNEALNEDLYAPLVKAEGGKLTGTKMCVPYANIATRVLVIADDNGEAGLFLLDPKADGVEQIALRATTREPQFQLNLTGAAASKIGAADAVQYLVERLTAAVCAFQIGVVEKATKMTAEYTAEREQFGVKIATFQAVGHRAADCYIDTTCLRLVTQQAVSLLEEEAACSPEVHVAKTWCGDASHRISYTTQQLHGGMGVDRDYPLWRYALWCKQNEMTYGSSAYHLDQLADGIANGQTTKA